MTPIITLLVVLSVSLLVTRVATVALTFTGLSREHAKFQARSAWTGCGYTTSEAEDIVNHPVRRRIIMMLMFAGNAGVVATLGAMLASMVTITQSPNTMQEAALQAQDVIEDQAASGLAIATPQDEMWESFMAEFVDIVAEGESALVTRLLVLGIGVVVLFVLASSKWVERRLARIIERALKRFTRLEAYDFLSVLRLSDGYTVAEFKVAENNWVVGKSLQESRLSSEGIQVLGIHRKSGTYIGTPTGTTFIRDGDTLTMYGQGGHLENLDNRPSGADGDSAHARACEAQHQRMEGERRDEPT